MKKLLCACFAFGIISTASLASDSPSAPPLIGFLDPSVFDPGIGCTFSPVKDTKKTVYEELDHKLIKGPWMEIQGKVVKLTGSKNNAWPEKKGSKSTLTFTAGTSRIILDVLQTSECQVAECAGVSYDGTITVISSGSRESMKVIGGCSD